jgi:hypothetical protein
MPSGPKLWRRCDHCNRRGRLVQILHEGASAKDAHQRLKHFVDGRMLVHLLLDLQASFQHLAQSQSFSHEASQNQKPMSGGELHALPILGSVGMLEVHQ